ncbi:hypothetical protein ACH42_02370 [Endozoicomonas sp. (ex Bugula neritina AB1)]|nr:hypothetical protein ACH42_02370 [Endozoicomonas sp. (ex Bugula neritina AB1)]
MTQTTNKTPGLSGKVLKLSLPILVLVIASVGAWQIIASAPTASKRTPQAQTRLVDIKSVVQKDINITVSGLGTVIPSQQLQLYSEVSGQIESIRDRLFPGSQIRKGELLVSIEAMDYQILLQKQQAEVALAEADFQKEMGQQIIARQELELIGRELTPAQKSLVLRQPELTSAKAKLAQAKASLAQAQLDVERTKITAPFDAQIIERTVENGSQINTNTALMNIVATNEFWLELEIPAEKLQWLEFGKNKNTVTLTSPAWSEKSRKGRLLSLSPELEPGSRMAKVIISIDDPMALKEENKHLPKILLNDLVRAEIAGKEVEMAAIVPDSLLHNGNQLWLYRSDNTLEIRTVSPIYRDAKQAVITEGLTSNDKLVTSVITAAVEGMPLRTTNEPTINEQKTEKQISQADKRSEQE